MLQIRGGLDLLEESLGAEDGREFGAEDLEGDLAVVAEVVREIHRGHAALAQLAVEAVAILKCGGQTRRNSSHGTRQGRVTQSAPDRGATPASMLEIEIELLGEIAISSRRRERTASAHCEAA